MVQRQHGEQGSRATQGQTQVSGMMQIGQRLFSGRVAVAQAAPHAHTHTDTHTDTHTHTHARTHIHAHTHTYIHTHTYTLTLCGASLLPGYHPPRVQAALVFGRHLFAKTRGYTDTKLCWAPRGLRPPLSMLPQLSSLYEEADAAFEYAEQYAARCDAVGSRVARPWQVEYK